MPDKNEAIRKGNHKSAIEHIDILRDQVKSEIELGYQFPFDVNIINKIKGSVVAPCGMAVQTTFNELKQQVVKYRPTHDLSIDQSPNNSLNHRLVRESLPELCYGWCISRLLHCMHALRREDGSRTMLIG